MAGRRKNEPSKALIETAYHEAGHAVIRLFGTYYRRGVRRATVVPHEDTLGRVMNRPLPKGFRPDFSCDPGTERRLRDQIMVSLAGGISARMKCGHASGLEGDNGVIAGCLERLVRSEKTSIAWMRIVRDETEGQLRRWWPAVEAVVEALLREQTLDGKRVGAIAREAMKIPDIKFKPLMRSGLMAARPFAASNEPGTCLWCGKVLSKSETCFCGARCARPFAEAIAEHGTRIGRPPRSNTRQSKHAGLAGRPKRGRSRGRW